jgi:elongation factor Ts
MAAITASMVNELRKITGCGMMECKKALSEANGDMDEAVKVLREKGLAVAAKKADRIAAEGVVDILVADDKKSAAMIEVNAETDFVAKNAVFLEFVRNLLKTILANRPQNVEELLTMQYVDTDMNVEAKLKDMIFTIGENMNIRRFIIVDGIVGTYIHGKGSTGVIVTFDTDDNTLANPSFAEFSKNIALQVAGAPSPVLYLNRESVPEKDLEEEKAIIMAHSQMILRTQASLQIFLKRWLLVSLVSSMKRTAYSSKSM